MITHSVSQCAKASSFAVYLSLSAERFGHSAKRRTQQFACTAGRLPAQQYSLEQIFLEQKMIISLLFCSSSVHLTLCSSLG